jgi:Lrp/AsnC family leucine-responsive transcriptional regulator
MFVTSEGWIIEFWAALPVPAGEEKSSSIRPHFLFIIASESGNPRTKCAKLFRFEDIVTNVTVDRHDLAILAELQRDGQMTNSALGERIHLSTSQVSRRVQRLEEAGVIDHYAAVLDPAAVGLGVLAITHVVLDRQGDAHGDNFEKAVAKLPEVLECFSVAGEADYVLRIVAYDLAEFSEFMMKNLLHLPGVSSVKSTILLQKVKQTSVLPLDHLVRPRKTKQLIRFSNE